jgi:hypothetical protein
MVTECRVHVSAHASMEVELHSWAYDPCRHHDVMEELFGAVCTTWLTLGCAACIGNMCRGCCQQRQWQRCACSVHDWYWPAAGLLSEPVHAHALHSSVAGTCTRCARVWAAPATAASVPS